MNFDRIPDELKLYAQFIVWRYETPYGSKPTKVPYNPKNGFTASVSDRNSWASFDEAVIAHSKSNGRYDGIGFVFTDNDPFCGIDLDDPNGDDATFKRQLAIFDYLPSYAEYSPSGKGVHIIAKATVPVGRKRSLVEIYSTGRYFTMTGNVMRDMPVNEIQTEVMSVWDQMGIAAEPHHFLGDAFQKQDDEAVYKAASEAKNGDLFVRLWKGDWSGYPSNSDGSGSSEADFALIDILAYYSKNRMQIQRMFETSALGKRDKYAKASFNRRATLIGYMITKSFDLTLPPVDLDAILNSINAALAFPSSGVSAPLPSLAATAVEGERVDTTPPPISAPSPKYYDGFDLTLWRSKPIDATKSVVGAVADYVYSQSPRPAYETSLAAALGFMAGMCGRSFNISGTGLNLYIMLLAVTGVGKEAMGSGLSKLIEAVASTESAAGQKNEAFRSILGPADMASGQGLLKHLSEANPPCFVSVTGEIGIRLQQISNERATNAESQLLRVMLDLFNKSGAGNTVQPTVYSDKTKNTEVIHSPSFSLLGEGVPDTFYNSLDDRAVGSGLLPRFLIIEHEGTVPYLNTSSASAKPPAWLIEFLDKWHGTVLSRAVKGEVYSIPLTPEAEKRSAEIDRYQTDKINHSTAEVHRQLWNRFHIKVLKVAAILAIGDNPHTPKVTVDNIEWAASLIATDIVRLMHKFDMGMVGARAINVTSREKAIIDAIRYYVTTEWTQFPKAMRVRPDMHGDRVIPYSLIQNRIGGRACFTSDARGSTAAIHATLKDMTLKGYMSELTDVKQREKYGVRTATLYVLDDVEFFMNYV